MDIILFVFGRVLERARWTVAPRHPEMMDTGNTEHPRPGRHDTRQCASKSGESRASRWGNRPYRQGEAVLESRRLRHKATDDGAAVRVQSLYQIYILYFLVQQKYSFFNPFFNIF